MGGPLYRHHGVSRALRSETMHDQHQLVRSWMFGCTDRALQNEICGGCVRLWLGADIL